MAYIVSATLLVVAGFGIYNIMSMTVNDKMKDIAILKATGFSGRDIVQIFLTQAVIIGFLGALLGVGLGFLFSWMISRVPFETPGDFFSIDRFPVNSTNSSTNPKNFRCSTTSRSRCGGGNF